MKQNATTLLFNDRAFAHYHDEMKGLVEERVFGTNLKGWLKGLFEDAMLVEFETNIVGVEEYCRDEAKRKNQRNGFYLRSLQTVHGLIKDLRVPRPRVGGFTPKVFERYERRERKLNELMVECFWRGISTRDMTFIMEQIADVHVSASVVSRLTQKWNEEAKLYHLRPLSDDYVYIMFDGVWIKNRCFGRKRRRLILVAYGVRADGSREIIDYKLECSESEESWQQFLTELVARGLIGQNLKLIVSDGCKGLQNAIALVYPLTPHQLCWAHKMRNILGNVKRVDQKAVQQGLSKIFNPETTTKQQVTKIMWDWRKKWRTIYPKAVACLDRDIDRLMLYLDLPVEHHKAIRTSNHIERQFKEFRRRLRSMEVLPNKGSAERAMYALTKIRNEKLKAYPLIMTFTQNSLH
jgi:transposase-like protein